MSHEKNNSHVAVLGGDGRPVSGVPRGARIFRAQGSAGNGELRRLLRALRSGSIAKLIILARWNAHSATAAVTRLCRQRGILIEMMV